MVEYFFEWNIYNTNIRVSHIGCFCDRIISSLAYTIIIQYRIICVFLTFVVCAIIVRYK